MSICPWDDEGTGFRDRLGGLGVEQVVLPATPVGSLPAPLFLRLCKQLNKNGEVLQIGIAVTVVIGAGAGRRYRG